MGNTWETVADFVFLGSKISADSDCSHKIEKRLLLGGKAMTNLYSILKNRDITLMTKVHLVKAMVFPVVMYGCKSWVPKNGYFWTVVLEKTLESPLDCKEIQPVHSKGDQPWDFFGRNDAKCETPILWPLHVKSWLIGRVNSLEELTQGDTIPLMLGGIEGRRKRGQQRMRWLDGITE